MQNQAFPNPAARKRIAAIGIVVITLVLSFVILPIPAQSSKSYSATAATSFAVGAGGTDVIPHQIVRTQADYLYLMTMTQYSNVVHTFRTTNPGLPNGPGDFDAPVDLITGAAPLSVDAVYDGSTIIHVLVNTVKGQIVDYPYDISSNTFKSGITLYTDGGMVSGDYLGTSGISGMVDKNGKLHVAYWSNQNHIIHSAYSHNSTTNTLTRESGPTQVDTAGSANHPVIAVSPFDNSLTIAWVSQADNPVKIRARSRTAGGSWSSAELVSAAPVWTSTNFGVNIDQGPSLIIDSAGTKHLAYIENWDSTGDYGRIHYARNTGTEWQDQALSAYSHDPALAINSAGDLYLIGHGHPQNPLGSNCRSMLDMCTLKRNSDGTWGLPILFATHPNGASLDSSPSVKWSVVGWNRPETIEFLFFSTPYLNPTVYYARLASGTPPTPVPFRFSKISAKFDQGKVMVKWKTEGESSLSGFDVYRKGKKPSAAWTRLNASRIPPQNPGGGASYTYPDLTVKSRKTYDYRVQAVFQSGNSQDSAIVRITIP